MVEEAGIPGKNHQSAACLWKTLSHNVASSIPRLSGIRTHNTLNLAVSFNRYVIYVSELSTYCLFSLFCFLSFGHCIVCPLNYDFWSSFWYIQIFLLLKFTLLRILHVYFNSYLCFPVGFFYLRSNKSLLSLDFFTRIFVLEWAAAVRQLQSIVPNNTRYIVGIWFKQSPVSSILYNKEYRTFRGISRNYRFLLSLSNSQTEIS